MEYSGIVAFDSYRTKQAAWLKEALKQDVFQDAPYRVVVVHMPPFGGWHGEQEIADKFVPLLEEAGIDVMLCGHLHRYVFKKAGEGQNFPIIANSNKAIIKASTENSALKFNVFDVEGKLIDSLTVKPRK
jgi:Icc-related predicted phosphoesterase